MVPHHLDTFLDETGYGAFHVILLLVCGCALSSDSIELYGVSFVIPIIDDGKLNDHSNIHPTKFQAGALNSIIFLGMMFGSYFWGLLADIIGRKSCIIGSSFINGIFGLASSLSPNFSVFMVFRFMSGFGVGGSAPVLISYFSEFFSSRYHGVSIIVLVSFWSLGTIYTSLLAWFVVPCSIRFHIGTMEFTSWRVFLSLCTLPCFMSILFFLCLPESLGFLLSKNKSHQVQKTLKCISACSICKSPTSNISQDELRHKIYRSLNSPDEDQLLPRHKKILIRKQLKKFWSATVELFKPPLLLTTAVLIIVTYCLAFGSYGLYMWFPEYFKYIESLSNTCTTINSTSETSNCTANSSSTLQTANIYRDSLFTSMANIPCIVLGAIFVKCIGSRMLLGLAMIVSAISSLTIWVVPKIPVSVVILSCVFTGFCTMCWTVLDAIVPESFPVHLRTTSFGLLSAIGRLGAICGVLLFGRLITVSLYLPVLIVASVLSTGGLVILFTVVKKVLSRKRRRKAYEEILNNSKQVKRL